MKIHILADNTVNKRGLLAEHGLSLFIEHDGLNLLFDTGQSAVYRDNAAAMGVDLQRTDFVVLSHGHYDHCGGLAFFPAKKPFPPVYAHPDAFSKRYKASGLKDGYTDIGIPWRADVRPAIRESLVYVQKTADPFLGVHLVSEIPSTTEFEGIPEGFFTEKSGKITTDMFIDEQMLVIETDQGLVIFLGCSHPGVINCLRHARKLFPGKAVFALFAGMHMGGASPLKVEMTIQYMLDFGIQRIVPLHCTGIFAISTMKRFLKERCLVTATGDTVEL